MSNSGKLTQKDLAIWLHKEYEALALEENWKTQENCQTNFDELPEENKNVMLRLADKLMQTFGVGLLPLRSIKGLEVYSYGHKAGDFVEISDMDNRVVVCNPGGPDGSDVDFDFIPFNHHVQICYKGFPVLDNKKSQ